MTESKTTLWDHFRWLGWHIRFWVLRQTVCRFRDHDEAYGDDYWAGDQHCQQWPYCRRCQVNL